MSAPSALQINLPATFANSFWSAPQYRRGAQSLYAKLQAGIDENTAVLSLISHRAELEYNHAEALATPLSPPSFGSPLFREALTAHGGTEGARGFAGSDSTISHAFRALEAEATAAQANAHGQAARNLERLIIIPFTKWTEEHKERITSSWNYVDAALERFERQKTEVEKLRNSYEARCRSADEAEDDARFAPAPPPPAASVTSPTLSSAGDSKIDEAHGADPDTLKRRETLRKQFGFGGRERAKDAANSGFAGVTSAGALSPQMSDDHYTSMGRSISSGSSALGSPRADGETGGLKRSNTLGAYLSSAVARVAKSDNSALAPLAGALGVGEPRAVRLRREADAAERGYAEGVSSLDGTRLFLEQALMEHYALTQRWETDRLRAIKAVLLSYNASLSALLPALDSSFSRSFALQESVQPDVDLAHLIHDARTGPFRPAPQTFHPYYHDEPAAAAAARASVFGADLTLSARLLALDEDEKALPAAPGAAPNASVMPTPPAVLSALLSALSKTYPTLAASGRSDEARKAWIYEVPLPRVHAVRNALITLPNAAREVPSSALERFDAPLLAATTKLWALELENSLVPVDLWELVGNVYAAAASTEKQARPEEPASEAAEKKTEDNEQESSKPKLDPAVADKIRQGVLEDLAVVLARLPKVHLVALDALIGHLHSLIQENKSEEPDNIFLNKLGLSLGRCILRPKAETALTIAAKHPSLLVMDLVAHYPSIFPALMERKARETEAAAAHARRMPVRKRTAMVDQRISRSSLGHGPRSSENGARLLAMQHEERSAHSRQPSAADGSAPPPVEKDGGVDSPVEMPSSEIGKSERGSPAIVTATSAKPVSGDAAPSITAQPPSPATTVAPAPALGEAADSGSDSAYVTPTASAAAEPISNVARLSRQFGSLSSGTGVRGPRPAGARVGRSSPSIGSASAGPGASEHQKDDSLSSAGNRLSRDLRPDDHESRKAERDRRRRSWSRTVDPNEEAELVGGDEDS